MGDPVLYGLSRSVYTRIARLALEEKGVRYTLEEVEIFDSPGAPAEHLARHPFGRIPAIEHGDFRLYEAQAIVRYIDQAFDGPSLTPADPRAQARMNQVIVKHDVCRLEALEAANGDEPRITGSRADEIDHRARHG